jgi:hypothetical protein
VTAPADSSAIDNALIARLAADATLLSLMPNGVYYAVAPPGATRYVLVAIESQVDVAEFGRRAQEDTFYRVTAVGLSTAHPDMPAAALRIDELLEDSPLTVDGFVWATMHRARRVRETLPDNETPGSLLWQHRGGIYHVLMATAPAGARR